MSISEIDVHDLTDGVDALVDVREVDEYVAGHIPGAVNVPLSELTERVGECLLGPVVHVVCGSGARSQRACEFLSQQPGAEGMAFVNIAGGTRGWISHGREVVTGESPR